MEYGIIRKTADSGGLYTTGDVSTAPRFAPGEEWRDPETGAKYKYCYAATALTAGTPYQIVGTNATAAGSLFPAVADFVATAETGVQVCLALAAATGWCWVLIEGLSPIRATVANTTYTMGTDDLLLLDKVLTKSEAAGTDVTTVAWAAETNASSTTSLYINLKGTRITTTAS
jgi:hypothetical protein